MLAFASFAKGRRASVPSAPRAEQVKGWGSPSCGWQQKLSAGPSCQGPGLGLTTECPPVLSPQNSWVPHAFPDSLYQIMLSRRCGREGLNGAWSPSGTAPHFRDGKMGLERRRVPTVTQKVGNRAEPGPLDGKMSRPLPPTSPATPSPRPHLLLDKYSLSASWVGHSVLGPEHTAESRRDKLPPGKLTF